MLIRVPDDILLRFPDIKLSDVLTIQRAAGNAELIVPHRAEVAAPARRKPGPKPGLRKAKPRRKASAKKRSAPNMTPAGAADQILDAIGSGSMKLAEVIKATGLDSTIAARVLAKLRKDGKVAAEGKAKGMSYCTVRRYDHSLPPNGAKSSRDVTAEAE